MPADTQANPGGGPYSVYYADPANPNADPNSPAGTRNYDPMNRRRCTQDPRGQQTTFSYDPDGRLHALVSPSGGQTTFGYDLRGRPRLTTYPDSTNEQWTYDAGGNLAARQTRAGVLQAFRAYDNRNRPGGYDWNDGGLTRDVAEVSLDLFECSAGRPISPSDSPAGKVKVPAKFGLPGAFVLRSNGDSMKEAQLPARLGSPGGIQPGDRVVMQWVEHREPRTRDIVAAQILGDGGTLKRYFDAAGEKWL